MVIFIGITEIIVWCIFQNSYHMETLQIIYNFFSSAAVIVSNVAYIFMHNHKKQKDILSSLSLYHHDLVMLCVNLSFIADNILISFLAFFQPRATVQFTYKKQNSDFSNTDGRPDTFTRRRTGMLNRKLSEEGGALFEMIINLQKGE